MKPLKVYHSEPGLKFTLGYHQRSVYEVLSVEKVSHSYTKIIYKRVPSGMQFEKTFPNCKELFIVDLRPMKNQS